MIDIEIEFLPFYWRLSPQSKKLPNVVDDYFPFAFDFDVMNGLVLQKRNEDVLKALYFIYTQDFNIGYLQDANDIAKPYGQDFIGYLYKVLEENPNVNKVLEIGCGGCVVLDSLQKSGYKVCGIDSSPFAKKEGAKKGVKVITDFFPSEQIPENFDMIFSVDVLEHVCDYMNFLEHQYEKLNDDGILIVNVPDATDSISIGDISMAMHQHLNYFTKTSLKAAINNAGFEVISVDNSGYGGSLYAMGRKSKKLIHVMNVPDRGEYENFTVQVEHAFAAFFEYFDMVQSNKRKTLGIYVPLRSLPYLAKRGIYKGYRFFDDTAHWHMNVFDGIDIPIENFSDLKLNPVTDLLIMSLTFGDVIRNKVLKEFGMNINVVTLADLLGRSE